MTNALIWFFDALLYILGAGLLLFVSFAVLSVIVTLFLSMPILATCLTALFIFMAAQ